jgi:DNA-binding response OmpR family regulator
LGDPVVASTPVASRQPAAGVLIPSGIGPLDERIGGLQPGGSYLVVGTPGPAKMVAALQFLHVGLARGEKCLLLSNADVEDMLGVARAWGFDFERAWHEGQLHILGFKHDFELRAIRSIEPDEVMEELGALVPADVARIAVEPGSMFLAGGAKSVLGAAFLKWARTRSATVCSTFSVDGAASSLPSSADWLVNATTGRLIVEWRAEELYDITLAKAQPGAGEREETFALQLKPGAGLVVPESWPARRGRDRPGIDENRLLLISLGGSHAADVETWASGAFKADIVTEPFEAVARVQSDPSFGGVLVHAPRARVREAVSACRALRPLTRAAIVFTSDDAVRSTDRIQVMEAGADDCLSGGIDFRELDLRIRQAIATGSKPAPAQANAGARTGNGLPGGGSVDPDRFEVEFLRRSADPVLKFFCVLEVASDSLGAAAVEEVLVEHVRADEGDLVAADTDRCAVLLQGAREGQLGPFLERLRSRLSERANSAGREPSVTVLSHPADAARIKAMVEKLRGAKG